MLGALLAEQYTMDDLSHPWSLAREVRSLLDENYGVSLSETTIAGKIEMARAALEGVPEPAKAAA